MFGGVWGVFWGFRAHIGLTVLGLWALRFGVEGLGREVWGLGL